MNDQITQSFSWVLLFTAVSLAGCNRNPNSLEGSIGGEEFGEVLDAIFVGDVASDGGDFKLMLSNFENACQNYKFYAENQLYDIASVDEGAAEPRYLLFTAYLVDEDLAGTREVLPAGGFYPGTMSFLSGRYSEGDGDGDFVATQMTGGSISFAEIEDGSLLAGELSVEFDSGDGLTGEFEAVFCEP